MSTETTESGQPNELKRVMGPKLLLLFIVGDILGAGVYAVTGEMAGNVGGIVWLPFLLAFIVATITALSYLELVTKYPQAAGAALYTHKAFGIHFVTFLVAFAVVCSGITSASTASATLAGFLTDGLEINGWIDGGVGEGTITTIAMLFMVLLALINLRGVGESVKFNVVLTLVEITALLIVIGVGFYVIARGDGDLSRITVFEDANDKGIFLAVTGATSIAFFAMVGFEDAVNMVEEVENPKKIFPRTMLTGLGIAVILYMLVAVSVVSVLTSNQIREINDNGDRALLSVVSVGLPDFPVDRVFPFLAVFAVANTALINMLMASRLIYGMARQDVLPRQLGVVLPGRRTPWAGILFTTLLALALIFYVRQDPDSDIVVNLATVTSLLLLCVFAVVNIACMVLRGKRHDHVETVFRSPGPLPVLGAVLCLFLAGPWVERDSIVYEIAAGLMVIGIILWAITYTINRMTGQGDSSFKDVDSLGE
ncbi:APC family permease [Aeromicrobium chenweiae]|uniref:Amino acid permease n=1 Tax=Aeromicrobium chenweiae TaxID=2079793 RepID=A0A2S0WLF0_9ACTN|nr:APC family permease [Aeromicrobium chenweiae]AWB92169.1 amino acid permease [Aeromicrobium chenweiae]TGN33023.1 amino acid permease [Aeromicrobium chenweiae]